MIFTIQNAIRNPEAVGLDQSGTVLAAAGLMREHDIGAVLIVENNKLAGIFTERDVSFRVIATGLDPSQTSLADVMTPDPQTIGANETIYAALERMIDQHFRHLPVYDREKLCGVVALRDLVFACNTQIAGELEHMSVAETQSICRIVADMMTRDKLVFLQPSDTVRQAAQVMASHDIGAVLISENGPLQGIFTERDVSFSVVSVGLDPDTTKLSDVMTSDFVAVKTGECCEDVSQKMMAGNFRHLPVVENGKTVGILSIRDLHSYIRGFLEARLHTAMIDRARDMMSLD